MSYNENSESQFLWLLAPLFELVTMKSSLASLLLVSARLIRITQIVQALHRWHVKWFLITLYGCWLYELVICRIQLARGLKKKCFYKFSIVLLYQESTRSSGQ